MPADETTGSDSGWRGLHKRTAVLQAARATFLAHGFGATVDEIAARAAVSKQTIYKHFGDKDRLFLEAVSAAIDEAERQTEALLTALPETTDLAGDLRAFARHHIHDVTQPHLLQMRRMIIAEAERFPELARHWFETGPEKGVATLAAIFARLGERGLLRVPDAHLAAQQFNWLVLSIPLNRALFLGTPGMDEAELARVADEAVRIFLAAYGA